MPTHPEVEAHFDARTWTLTYLVWDPETRDALVIDSVLDYDPLPNRTWTESNDRLMARIDELGLRIHWVLETHAHADHLSGSQDLKSRTGAKIGIGAGITAVQETFKPIFGMEALAADGSQFDRLLEEGALLQVGSLRVEILATPGHTPACVTYKIGNAIFVGDALFMPDYGTGRCDFPRGSAVQLYHSIHDRLYALPDDTRVFVGHDYQPGGRELAWETSIGASKAGNKQLKAQTSEADYVRFRTERDATLSMPKLLFQSIQVNIAAGHLPEKGENGIAYLKVPLNLF